MVAEGEQIRSDATKSIESSCLEVKIMATKKLDKKALGRSEDWYGNNAALRCPVCRKVFIVSEFLNKGQRGCPSCHTSSAEITKESVTLTWPDHHDIPTVWTREELIGNNRLEEFVSLVGEGGAVEKASIKAKLPKAEKVAFIERNGKFVAVAAKKRANANYVEGVAKNSKYPLDSDTPELGYVEVSKTCRGNGFQPRLCGESCLSLEMRPSLPQRVMTR
jgi:hypothetical protein